MHVRIANVNDMLILIKQLLLTLTALHKQKWVHRDVRMDNLVHSPAGWVLIDWELAGPAGHHVFWDSTYLPPEVHTGQMPYTATSDLWQVGRIIQRYDALSTGATKKFANQLISKQFANLLSMPCLPYLKFNVSMMPVCCVYTDITALVATRFRTLRLVLLTSFLSFAKTP
ncbi:TPA: hypothetical protein ACH3X1_016662 [Trebouxia sp. C0004]